MEMGGDDDVVGAGGIVHPEAGTAAIAGHQVGEKFEISCHNPGGLCGFFYHDIFPHLETFQFGGSLPWWEGDTIHLQCPDSDNLVTLKVERSKRV